MNENLEEIKMTNINHNLLAHRDPFLRQTLNKKEWTAPKVQEESLSLTKASRRPFNDLALGGMGLDGTS